MPELDITPDSQQYILNELYESSYVIDIPL